MTLAELSQKYGTEFTPHQIRSLARGVDRIPKLGTAVNLNLPPEEVKSAVAYLQFLGSKRIKHEISNRETLRGIETYIRATGFEPRLNRYLTWAQENEFPGASLSVRRFGTWTCAVNLAKLKCHLP